MLSIAAQKIYYDVEALELYTLAQQQSCALCMHVSNKTICDMMSSSVILCFIFFLVIKSELQVAHSSFCALWSVIKYYKHNQCFVCVHNLGHVSTWYYCLFFIFLLVTYTCSFNAWEHADKEGFFSKWFIIYLRVLILYSSWGF